MRASIPLRAASVLIAMWLLVASSSVAAQGEQSHPVVDGLISRDVGGMHFYLAADDAPRLEPLLKVAPMLRSRIVADLTPGTLDQVHIYLLDDLDTYFEAIGEPAQSPHWAAGLTLWGSQVVLIRLEASVGQRLELDRTLAHELSHVALRRTMGNNHVPHWLIEGFALLQTEQWTIARAGTLAEASLSGRLIALGDIDQGFPGPAPMAQLAYAESGHFVRFLIQRHGRPKFRAWLRTMARGVDAQTSFQQVFGEPMQATEAVWREGLVVDHGWLAIFVASGTLFFALAVMFLGSYVRVRRGRKTAFAKMEDAPAGRVPEHLREFGPFAHRP